MTRRLAPLLALGLFVAAPRMAEACTCGNVDYAASYAKSTYVFRGRVTGAEGDVGHFEVLGYYKGQGPKEVHVRALGAGMCRHRFETGSEYVVFAEEHLSIGFCGTTIRVRVEGQRWGTPEAEVVETLKQAGIGESVAPGDGEPLKPPPKSDLDSKMVAEHEENPFGPDPQWPEPAEKPARGPKSAVAPEAKPEPPKASGCMGRVAPESPPWGLSLFLLAALRRRR